jgi:hypothetical protein
VGEERVPVDTDVVVAAAAAHARIQRVDLGWRTSSSRERRIAS